MKQIAAEATKYPATQEATGLKSKGTQGGVLNMAKTYGKSNPHKTMDINTAGGNQINIL